MTIEAGLIRQSKHEIGNNMRTIHLEDGTQITVDNKTIVSRQENTTATPVKTEARWVTAGETVVIQGLVKGVDYFHDHNHFFLKKLLEHVSSTRILLFLILFFSSVNFLLLSVMWFKIMK